MDYEQMKREKDARYEEYCKTYEDQLRLQRYIDSLEEDNEINRNTEGTTFGKRWHLKRVIRVNTKDIKMYKKALSRLPEVPPFK